MVESKVDLVKHSFYGVEVEGLNLDGDMCKLAFYVRIGVCGNADCCCSHGLVRYETTVKELHGDEIQEQCAAWTLTTSSAAAIFFGNWRVEAQSSVQHKCMAPNKLEKTMACKYYSPASGATGQSAGRGGD